MASEKKIAVTGATGHLGHHAVEILRERGHEVMPISRGVAQGVATGPPLRPPGLPSMESTIADRR